MLLNKLVKIWVKFTELRVGMSIDVAFVIPLAITFVIGGICFLAHFVG